MAAEQPGQVRVLVVDDSAFFRRMVVRCLEGLPGVSVVGMAGNGKEALRRLQGGDVDLMIIDIKMPEMDGLETLEHLHRSLSKVRVIVLSGHTRKVAEHTISALLLGAEDFVVKPASGHRAEENMERLQQQLSRVILGHHPASRRGRARGPLAQLPSGSEPRACEAVLIGSSTGGPRALSALLRALPLLNLPLLIVQHLPEGFSRSLAERLDGESAWTVKEATDGETVRGGVAYLAPGGAHMEVHQETAARQLFLHRGSPINHCRPSVDLLFRSAATCYGKNCLALLLTGMGSDGLRGAEQLSQVGAEIWGQDRLSSVVWGMPGAVVEAGLAKEQNLSEMPGLIAGWAASGGAGPLHRSRN